MTNGPNEGMTEHYTICTSCAIFMLLGESMNFILLTNGKKLVIST